MPKTSLQPRFWGVPSEGREELFDVFAPFGPDFGPGGPKNALFGVLGLHPRVFTCKNGQKVDFATRDLVFSTFWGVEPIYVVRFAAWASIGSLWVLLAEARFDHARNVPIGPVWGQSRAKLGPLGANWRADWGFWDPNWGPIGPFGTPIEGSIGPYGTPIGGPIGIMRTLKGAENGLLAG